MFYSVQHLKVTGEASTVRFLVFLLLLNREKKGNAEGMCCMKFVDLHLLLGAEISKD